MTHTETFAQTDWTAAENLIMRVANVSRRTAKRAVAHAVDHDTYTGHGYCIRFRSEPTAEHGEVIEVTY